ncbi:non-canonical purine NTP diphosphatase [Chondrinema litorale]|uniref:non-canonical purine NTP diphosphatase n=1 Tax=Chondrinema litorale TaxID=2994555 RepID=UPI002542E48F|nr:non-canonical purine NTP diphosphatase [Chondrinema litorale]UZR93247.1 non-canonical purine NTP diphosphatase [Chondrinema litorale]
MKPSICFATNNPHKLKEIQEILADKFQIVSLKEIGCEEDIPETQPTIEGNSEQKAQYVKDHYQIDCFADDTGLEVIALNNEPGVYSARYAGPQRNSDDNIALVLKNLESKTDRSAQFKTVITLIYKGETKAFEGIVKGEITDKPTGTNGFGYDPVFKPEGYDRTFAELSSEEKNKISHRGLAVEKLVAYLENIV